MHWTLAAALALPFLGTAVGAAGVFFMSHRDAGLARQGLSGFAAGVMTAASVWSLILPALEQSAPLGQLAFVPVLAGIWLGFLLLQRLEGWCAKLRGGKYREGSVMVLLAVALHNLPEGMAVGAACAGYLAGEGILTGMDVAALALGIALQNLPEGAIISMPLRAGGMRRGRAFGWGVASGAVEPVGAAVTVLLAGLLVPVLPLMLSFSAGAMLYVTIRELIPEATEGETGLRGALFFALGFGIMMAMDIALG